MLTSIHRFCPHLVAALVALSVHVPAPGQTGTATSAPRSSWQCLPTDTVFALRVPNGKAIVNALKETTKLGSVLLDDDRTLRFWELLSDQKEWDELREKLGEYGLSPDDLSPLIGGETGFAVMMQRPPARRSEGPQPRSFALAWVVPGSDLSQRLMGAIQQELENRRDEEPAIRRMDMDLDQHSVMLLTVPQVEADPGAGPFQLPDDFGELSPEQQREAIRQAKAEAKANRKTTIQYRHVLLTVLEDRLLAAASLDPTDDPDDRNRVDHLTAVFQQFLAAHSGEAGSFVARVESHPGIQQALPQEGVVFFELLADVSPALEMLLDHEATEADEAAQTAARVIRSLGVDQLGVVGFRSSLVDSVARSGIFVEAPSPRTGILGVLDQPTLDPEPEPWVPSSVVEYGHLSLDLGKLYTMIKELIIQEVGEPVETQFGQMERAVQGVAKADLATVLSSLGHQHTVLSFEPQMEEVNVPDGQPFAAPTDRMAMVWRVQDEALWNRLFQAGQAFVPLAQGAVEFGEEQGFSGYRAANELFDGGLFLGKGYLILAIGKDVIEQVLSVLNHPPTGKDALRNSDAFARGSNLLPLEPGLSFELSDDNRYAGFMSQMVDSLTTQLMMQAQQTDSDKRYRDFLQRLRALMPTEEEFENIFGVGVGYMRATEHGLEIKTANELPAP